jgi:DNA polymerase-3 subunit epsilon
MTSFWHDQRLCVIDFETTGTDPEHDRIVTAAVGYVGAFQEPDIHTLIGDPGIPIPAEAAAVHGWTNERIRLEGGRDPVDVLDIVLGTLDRRPEGSPVAVMNARFDLTILDRECRRYGLDPADKHRPLHVVDPRVLDLHLHRYRKGSRKLADLCRFYGAPVINTHAAGWDALAAGYLAVCMARRGAVIRRSRSAAEDAEFARLQSEWFAVKDDVQLLHVAQVRWAAEQAQGLAEHFDKTGQAHDVRTEWPVIPVEPNHTTRAAA